MVKQVWPMIMKLAGQKSRLKPKGRLTRFRIPYRTGL